MIIENVRFKGDFLEKLDINVLYAEDEPVIRLEMVEMLKGLVKNLYVANDGNEALEIFKEKEIDVVITDIRMPHLDGLKLAKAIRETGASTPIIIVTAYSDVEYLLDAFKLGVDNYLIKPIDFKQIISLLEKICEVKLLNQKLEQTRHLLLQYKQAMDLIAIVFKTDPDGNIEYVNEEFCKVIDKCREDIIGKKLSDVLCGEEKIDFGSIVYSIASEGRWQKRLKFIGGDRIYHISFTGLPIKNTDSGETLEYIFIGNDISELIEKEEELLKQLFTDKLTNLPNRLKLIYDLESRNYSALAIINIDGFKEVNDFYGIQVGDYVLVEIARRLKKYEESRNCRVYKLSSDEYAILFFSLYDSETLMKELESIRDSITEKKFIYNDNIIYISITIGVGEYTANEDDREYIQPYRNILLKADMALRKAKASKKGILLFSEDFNIFKEFENNIIWTKKLKEAISSSRFEPYFQPIVNNKTGKVEKFEALVRLIEDDGSPVSPAYFLSLSKRNRQYPFITKMMIEKSIEYFKDLPFELSINISFEDIVNKEIREFISHLISSTPQLKGKLTFELTETEDISKYEDMESFIKEMKSMGIKFAVDDFGSGYSNFDHLITLDFDYIKIDSSIIRKLPIEKKENILAKLIVDFARSLSIQTIAEFVASEEIYKKVIELGIDYSQGYFFSEPISLKQLKENYL